MTGLPGNPVTSGGGNYSATVDYGWSGTVTPTMTGYTFNPVEVFYDNVTADQLNQDYTPTLNTYTISGYILESDLTPIEGVSVTADNGGGSGSTDENGYYELSVDYDWSGTVTPQSVGYTFDPTDRSFSNVTADQSNQDYSGTLLTYVISGYILESDATPVVDVLVTADNDGGSNTTDINGYYELVVDHSWSGTTTPTKEGYSFNPATINYTNVITDLPNQNYTGVLILLTISGHILSPSGTGVEYVEVVASNSGGSDATDPNGYYELHVQYNWSGSVTPARENYACNPITIPCTQVTSNQEDQDYLITLKADLQPDGIINLLDLLVLKQDWLHTGPSIADMNHDNKVNLADVAILARSWYFAY